ncbi:peptidase [Rhizobium sp. KAs_5_22]|uniref:M10 family metallopeptidase C-terminal domain-containing protein n=1 Tax=Ciceribacter selenitireducens TaxID=448181 RepID=UPI0004BAE011|nr:M10 family metallopeptidase C-terminal domain-containing protein [Ciceribacter selenitireducens]PPJ46822.1 peptidase [Rhizobium sp. KAs_5_22]
MGINDSSSVLAATSANTNASFTETTDAAASTGTGYTMAAGDSFTGTLAAVGDNDWVRIQLTAGQTYTFTLNGSGGSPVYDTYLELLNSGGSILVGDDDGGTSGYNSAITFTATASGTYYLNARGLNNAYSGGYTLTAAVAPPPTVYTNDQIANQLTNGYWESEGASRRAFDINAGQSLTVNITALTAAGQQMAIWAFNAWTAATGIRFTLTSGTAQITFDDSDPNSAYSTSTTTGNTIVSSFVNVSTDWLDSYGTTRNSYSLQTYIHEIGHALGLGHAGNYNGNATYGVDNNYANDSWQATIMSYFSQTDNTYVEASYAFIVTPMIADILAMRDLYGVTAINAGNNTYNFQSDFGDHVARTIVDTGGIDTLNFSWVTAAQRIDLNPETYSDTGGLIGNLGIARGTIIENATGGSGNDILYGNSAANVLNGGSGNDVLFGRGGADTLNGGIGNDTYALTNENDTVIDSGGTDTITSTISRTLAAYATIERLTLTGSANINGTGNGLANIITGNAGNNVLDGAAGLDTLIGGLGNDTYMLGAENDTVTDSGGNDAIVSTITRSLVGYATIERLTLRGSSSINGTGNALDNVIVGNGANNTINGGAGDDTILGGAGVDRLYGSIGNDTLTGGTGIDAFVFHSAPNAATNVDTITDFSVADDVIWLENSVFTALGAAGALASTAFVRNTSGLAEDASDRLIYESDTGELYYDTNGSAAGGSTLIAVLNPSLLLTHLDFAVI